MYKTKLLKSFNIEALTTSTDKFLEQLDKSESKLINIGYVEVGGVFIAIITYIK